MKVSKIKYENAVAEVAKKLGLSEKEVNAIYSSFWKFVRYTISQMPIKNDYSEEKFNMLRTSVNIPSLGKFYCTYERYINMRKRFELLKSLKENETKKN